MGLQQQLSRVFFSFRNHWHLASVISCFQNYVGHKNIGNIGDEIFNMTRETWKSGALEGAMDLCAFVRVAEMSAAHKAFWLPLSQQSDTASDLGLIRLSIHNRKRMWKNCWNMSEPICWLMCDVQAVSIIQTYPDSWLIHTATSLPESLVQGFRL